MGDIILGNPMDILRVLIVGTVSYFMLILFIRISGKRTLSKMNAFDLIITVSLGSAFATVILNDNIEILEGMSALLLLIALQYVVSYTSARSKSVSRLIKSEPTLLYYQGDYMKSNMKKERVMEEEINQFLRNSGYSSYDEITAVILETDGSLSVLNNDGVLITNNMNKEDEKD